MKTLLGTKERMTQIYADNGRLVPVTIVRVRACVVVQVKTKETDGYTALQIGTGEKKHVTKPLAGHVKNLPQLSHGRGFRFIKECRVDSVDGMKRGDIIPLSQFQKGEEVEVTGWSKGKGFAGVVKRHGFHGHPTSHGHKDQERMPGSIGAGGVQHVFRGQRMAGRMGGERVTVKGVSLIDVDEAAETLTIQGTIPGAVGGLCIIRAAGQLQTTPFLKEIKETGIKEELPSAPEENMTQDQEAPKQEV